MDHQTTQMLRIRDVCQRTALSKSQLYRLVDELSFPAPVRLGRRACAWVEAEVEQWLRERIAHSRTGR